MGNFSYLLVETNNVKLWVQSKPNEAPDIGAIIGFHIDDSVKKAILS
jgi:hypothetical protein